jgi:hypothetical protein
VSRDERERLRDIVEALEAIRDVVGGSLEEPTVNGPVVLDAIPFRLIVIGEAAKNVSAELLESAADMRWSDISAYGTSSRTSTSASSVRSSRTRSSATSCCDDGLRSPSDSPWSDDLARCTCELGSRTSRARHRLGHDCVA